MSSWGWAALALAAALAAPRVTSDYALHVAVLSFIYLLPALGLNLVYGYAGLLSLAEGAFFGIGAYASALLALRFGWPFWLAFPAAGIACALLAVPMAVPALRLRSYSFVMVTLGFLVISESVAKNWVGLTRGDMGLIDIPRPRLAGVALASVTDFYYLTLAVAVVAALAFRALTGSAAGRALIALRDDETLAEAYGLDTWRFKLAAFVLGALLAGLGGSLYAHYTTVLDPLVFDVFHTLTLLTIVFGGGAGTLGGVLLGTLVFLFVPEALRIAPQWRLVLYGLLLIVLVFRLPGGLGPALAALAGRRARA
ncbi:MAG TPA: branched-chain amino acid ABC transporter permease [Methylomirabilota bacterium]|nr:branched-chain amino acid ABC transporter permease [Methylomirabilota bacterium]